MIKFNLVPMWVYGLAAICLAGGSGVAGWKLRDHDYQMHLKRDTEAALTASEAARNIEAKNEEIGQEISEKFEAREDSIRIVTRTIIQKVPEYVTIESDARCIVPVGAVKLLNAASAGTAPLPETPGEPHDAPSGVELSAVTESVVENYGTYHLVAEQLKALQEWAVEVEKAWPKPD